MRAVTAARRSTARLFAVYAVVSLIPIVALGFILAAHFRQEAQQRGIDQGRTEAQLIAQTAVEPLFDNLPLSSGLSAPEQAGMRRLVAQSVNRVGQGPLRLRLRDLRGHVVFSDDGTRGPVDDESLDAAAGETVADLTNLNADGNDVNGRGQRAVEVYLTAQPPADRRADREERQVQRAQPDHQVSVHGAQQR